MGSGFGSGFISGLGLLGVGLGAEVDPGKESPDGEIQERKKPLGEEISLILHWLRRLGEMQRDSYGDGQGNRQNRNDDVGEEEGDDGSLVVELRKHA